MADVHNHELGISSCYTCAPLIDKDAAFSNDRRWLIGALDNLAVKFLEQGDQKTSMAIFDCMNALEALNK